MNKFDLLNVFICVTLISLLVSCNSEKQNFKIDNTVSSVIDSILDRADIFYDSSKNAGCFVHVKNSFDYKKFGQNGGDLVYFLNLDSNKKTDLYKACLAECFLTKDTIDLTIVLNHDNNVAFQILIFGSKFNSKLRVIADEKIYSKNERENNLQKHLTISSDCAFLILTEKPEFKSGGIVKGKMEVKFESFYLVDTSGKLSKLTPQFSIVFAKEVR